jgi:hypothetical protein
MRLRIEDVQGRNCLTNFWVSGQRGQRHGFSPRALEVLQVLWLSSNLEPLLGCRA